MGAAYDGLHRQENEQRWWIQTSSTHHDGRGRAVCDSGESGQLSHFHTPNFCILLTFLPFLKAFFWQQKFQQNLNDTANDAWLTGIVEVELSMDEKLRNIEETELAKKKMLQDRQRGVMSSGFRVDTSTDKGYMRVDQKAKKKGVRREDKDPLNDTAKRLLMLPSSQPNYNSNYVKHVPTREVKEAAASTSGRCSWIAQICSTMLRGPSYTFGAIFYACDTDRSCLPPCLHRSCKKRKPFALMCPVHNHRWLLHADKI